MIMPFKLNKINILLFNLIQRTIFNINLSITKRTIMPRAVMFVYNHKTVRTY